MKLRKIELAFCALLALMSWPAQAIDHVLTITIDDYAPNATVGPLEGVKQDRLSALKIAERLGLDTSSPVQLQNKSATLAGIRNALDNLERAVSGNDRVFVYYSGHGGTKQVSSICQSSLITYEDEDLLSSEFYERLERIKSKVPKQLFVLLDACHSGDFTSRSSKAKGMSEAASMRPKMRTKAKDGQPSCNAPVNFVMSRMDALEKSRRAAKGTIPEALTGQMVMLSAARENEVAWDSDRGGAATSAALKCLTEPGLQSSEGSGFLSAIALSQCTQSIIDNEQPLATRQHVVAHGQTTAPLAPVWNAAGANVVANASNTLEALAQNSDPTWTVRIEPFVGAQRREEVNQPFKWSGAQRIKIGGPDRIQVTVQSDRPGYLYLVYASRDSNQFVLLFPFDKKNFYMQSTDTPITIPRRWPAEGNNGKPEQDTILAIVSEQVMPELHQYLQGGAKPASSEITERLAQAATSPCKAFGSGESTCSRVPRKALGSGEDTGGYMPAGRYGAARVIVDEY